MEFLIVLLFLAISYIIYSHIENRKQLKRVQSKLNIISNKSLIDGDSIDILSQELTILSGEVKMVQDNIDENNISIKTLFEKDAQLIGEVTNNVKQLEDLKDLHIKNSQLTEKVRANTTSIIGLKKLHFQ